MFCSVKTLVEENKNLFLKSYSLSFLTKLIHAILCLSVLEDLKSEKFEEGFKALSVTEIFNMLVSGAHKMISPSLIVTAVSYIILLSFFDSQAKKLQEGINLSIVKRRNRELKNNLLSNNFSCQWSVRKKYESLLKNWKKLVDLTCNKTTELCVSCTVFFIYYFDKREISAVLIFYVTFLVASNFIFYLKIPNGFGRIDMIDIDHIRYFYKGEKFSQERTDYIDSKLYVHDLKYFFLAISIILFYPFLQRDSTSIFLIIFTFLRTTSAWKLVPEQVRIVKRINSVEDVQVMAQSSIGSPDIKVGEFLGIVNNTTSLQTIRQKLYDIQLIDGGDIIHREWSSLSKEQQSLLTGLKK